MSWIGRWGYQAMELPQYHHKWDKKFAWWPTRLDCGTMIWFDHFFLMQTYMQNPYNGTKGYVVQKRISKEDYILRLLKKD